MKSTDRDRDRQSPKAQSEVHRAGKLVGLDTHQANERLLAPHASDNGLGNDTCVRFVRSVDFDVDIRAKYPPVRAVGA